MGVGFVNAFFCFLWCHSDTGHVIPSVAEESRFLKRSQGRAARFLGYARNDMGVWGDWGWGTGRGDGVGE